MIDSLVGFHIEPTNICTLKCAGCARTRFINQWPQHWKNHSLDIDQLLHFIDIDITGKRISLCGNYGDPIYHPDFINFVQRLKDRGANLSITTNGSYKTKEWWEELVSLLTSDDIVRFSIDGTPETFTQYRANANWESILKGIKVVAQSTCHSIWKYIPFAFNQGDVDRVAQLSLDLGIKEFKIDPSDRYDDQTQHLIPDIALLGERYSQQTEWKSSTNLLTVNPKCSNNREHFITAEGYYSPCCFQADYRFYYKTPFGKHKNHYDISQHTLTEILQQPKTVEFYQTLDQQPGCQYNCPKTPVDQ